MSNLFYRPFKTKNLEGFRLPYGFPFRPQTQLPYKKKEHSILQHSQNEGKTHSGIRIFICLNILSHLQPSFRYVFLESHCRFDGV